MDLTTLFGADLLHGSRKVPSLLPCITQLNFCNPNKHYVTPMQASYNPLNNVGVAAIKRQTRALAEGPQPQRMAERTGRKASANSSSVGAVVLEAHRTGLARPPLPFQGTPKPSQSLTGPLQGLPQSLPNACFGLLLSAKPCKASVRKVIICAVPPARQELVP